MHQPPSGAKEGDLEHLCYLPKKCVHRYTGHTKGVQAIEFFPKYGHLLLRYATRETGFGWSVGGVWVGL